MIPGGDDQLLIVAVYLDQASRWVASFNTQKLLQVPEGFGTGCIVQGVDRPELSEPTRRLLQEIGFTGIAEVEYKWDARNKRYSLIEINPRPWDQHRLGYACGVDLIYLAYLDRANLPIPAVARTSRNHRWIAEEAFLGALLHCVRRRDGSLKKLLSLARGPRVWGMWKWNDPLPLVAYMTLHFLPALATAVGRAILGLFRGKSDNADSSEKGRLYANSLDKGGTHGR
jgi:predicted ATP-grasp superfamily ATP-dependent carboligase